MLEAIQPKKKRGRGEWWLRLQHVCSNKMNRLIQVYNLPVLLMGFLLGRATILESVSPFAIAYLAVVMYLAKKQWPSVMLFLVMGSATVDWMHVAKISVFLILFVLFHRIFLWFHKDQIHLAPLLVAISSIIGQCGWSWYEGWTVYQLMLAGVDLLLSVILTFIFVHSLPIFTMRKKRVFLRPDEIICLIILLGSVITGMLEWQIEQLSIVNIISRYLICLFAFVGGGMLGASIGVVIGMTICLSDPKSMIQMGLLTFAGLMAGLFQEGKRFGSMIGFLLGSTILSLFQMGTDQLLLSLCETSIALGLFLLTPSSWVHAFARYVPGTPENQTLHQDYVRRLRDVTAAKVDHFAELFSELAVSFREDSGKKKREDEEQLHHFVQGVMEESCFGCKRYRHCWDQNLMRTYQEITGLMAWVEADAEGVPSHWSRYCIHSEKVLQEVRIQYQREREQHLWKEQLKETKRMVGTQLMGMSEVMERLSTEIRHETKVLTAQEEQIHESLEELGLSIQRVDVINLEEGRVEIEVTMPHRDAFDECRKLIAPLLTEILGEPIAVYRKVIKGHSSGSLITLGSEQRYTLKTGVAHAAKGGRYISGDSYCYMNLGTGKYAVALSDGMGNGQRAQEESSAALKLLKRLLQAGMKEETAVETVNSILSLRSADEIFATIDLALVDLHTAAGRFMKIGSTPGFIKRGKEVFMVSSESPPIGILSHIQVEPVEMRLRSGDLLIMMTDGVYDAPRHVLNKDAFMTRMISEIETRDPQDFADCLLEAVVRYHQGAIHDDMTVIVSKLERYTPEWSTIRLPGMARLERTQVALS
ncbi:stage II sporulation protein E [Seinonella peptonophila]|uniref:Stage II sporulation protein E n=1 Tax=Seinonella peptonophila TaxID=112248 RepID=A0A1M4YRU9_9BACL|nr:stage II sporulation protein E [Seinonella peptonophila]SHF08515.1 stage II sporulation protein E [Seinonella peptonophila]